MNLRAFVIASVYFLVSAILTLPWTLYADYFRETIYGRTSQPLPIASASRARAVVSAPRRRPVLDRRLLADPASGPRWWLWSGALFAVAFAFVILLVAGADRALVQQI